MDRAIHVKQIENHIATIKRLLEIETDPDKRLDMVEELEGVSSELLTLRSNGATAKDGFN